MSPPIGDPPPFTGLGFSIEPVRGARTFRYVNRIAGWAELGAPGQLIGVYYPHRWVDGPNYAECRKNDPTFNYFGPRHVDYEAGRVDIPNGKTFDLVPHDGKHLPSCGCGFYAYYDGSNDYYDPTKFGPDLIPGVIEGSGEVLVGMRGFRCTVARIVALTLPRGHAARELIGAHYPAAVICDTFERMVEMFPEEDHGIREEWRTARDAALEAKRERAAAAKKRAADKAANDRLDDDGGPVI